MTIEELQAELDKANDKIESLADSKKTILDEKKKLEKKYKEVDADEYFKLRDSFDNLEADYKKLEKANTGLTKDFEKANGLIAEKDGSLRKLIVTDAMSKSLNSLERHKLNDGALELAMMAIESKGVEVTDGVAMIGSKTLHDYINTDFLADPASKNLVTANPNSGGGAGGGDKSGGDNVNRDNMSPEQMMSEGRK